ncbi:hypothetical protein AB0B11_05410 [Micromonospora tulbaghiae]|uniref:hypothetical protein n=1 Tax=Micromonospora tulbaghiae TaxID=479978 RepID=UPI0033E10BA7
MSRFRLRPLYGAPIMIAILAAFVWNLAEPFDEPELPAEMFVVTGTVESVEKTWKSTTGGSRNLAVVVYRVLLREHPRVEFAVRDLPSEELVPGTPVRFEMSSDPQPDLERARLYDYATYLVRAETFVVDGTVIYDAFQVRAEAKERTDAAVRRYRSISLVLWAVVVVWVALLVRRHRASLRSLVEPDGASDAADRFRRWVYRE